MGKRTLWVKLKATRECFHAIERDYSTLFLNFGFLYRGAHNFTTNIWACILFILLFFFFVLIRCLALDDCARIPRRKRAESGSSVALRRCVDIGPIRSNSRSLYGRAWPLQTVSA